MATALLERLEVKEPEANQSEAGPVLYHWTVDALERATDAGVFEHPERLELIQGRIIENMSQGPRHATLASVVAEMLRGALGRQFAVREEKPIRTASDGEPIPDVSVLRGRQADYGDRQPGPQDTALVVEVSDTTAVYDLGGKALMYARAGVTDYWVVLVRENAIVVHREPSEGGYGSVTRLVGADTLSPLARPEAVWTVDALLGRTEAAPQD